MTAPAECGHGLPPGCPLHTRPLGRRVLDCAVVAAMGLLSAGSVVALVCGMWRAAAALWGHP